MELVDIEKVIELVEAAFNQTDMVEKNMLLESALKALHQLKADKKEELSKIFEQVELRG